MSLRFGKGGAGLNSRREYISPNRRRIAVLLIIHLSGAVLVSLPSRPVALCVGVMLDAFVAMDISRFGVNREVWLALRTTETARSRDGHRDNLEPTRSTEVRTSAGLVTSPVVAQT